MSVSEMAKWRRYAGVWKPTRSAPRMPCSSRSRMGSVRNSSSEGNGMWRKKPMRALGSRVAEEARQEQELVVVHPDHVAGPVVRGDDVGEALVRLDVAVPVADLERDLFQEVVEQGPEHPVREALVEPGDLVGGERHLHEPHGGERLVEARLPLGIEVAGRSRPPDPEPVRLLVRPHEARGQAAGAPLYLDARLGGLDGDGQAVGDDQEPGHPGKVSASSPSHPSEAKGTWDPRRSEIGAGRGLSDAQGSDCLTSAIADCPGPRPETRAPDRSRCSSPRAPAPPGPWSAWRPPARRPPAR